MPEKDENYIAQLLQDYQDYRSDPLRDELK